MRGCLPTCAQGSSVSVTGNVGGSAFLALWVLLGNLCIWEVLALLVFPFMSTRLKLRRFTYLRDTPIGRRSVGALSA